MAKLIQSQKYQEILLKDYAPPEFLIESAELEFNLDPKVTVVKSKLLVKKNGIKNKTSSLKLDGVNLELQEIKLNRRLLTPRDYALTPSALTIFKVPNEFILETVVKIAPEKNFSCTGLYLTNENFCTQNEPHGFRRLTYFIDRPDVLTKFTTTIIAKKTAYPVLLSNGNLIAKKSLKNGYHKTVWQDPYPKSAYLFALVAGKFACLLDSHVTTSGRKIILKIFTEAHQLEQCHHAMGSLKQAMQWDEQTFGLEYDLDLYQIVAINDLNFGAMENKGLNVFNSKLLLASPLTATDNDFMNVAAVIAHEYFHNWTGNRVTCRNWFQIGLKEGLTTLREQLFMEDRYGYPINRINAIKTMLNRQFPEDAGPLSHPIRLKSYIAVDNFYTVTVYHKSAEVARMFLTIFGKKTWQKIVHQFLTTFDGQAVTIEDFMQVVSKVTKTNLKQFKLWYDQNGTPLLKIKDSFKNGEYELSIEQKHKKPAKDFYIPVTISLLSPTGKNIIKQTLIVNKKRQNFSFKKITPKPVPSLLGNFSAPVKVEYSYTDQNLAFLILHDQDPINRWQASQKLMFNIIADLCNKYQQNNHLVLPQMLIGIFRTIINDRQIDPALAARLLELPSESYLLENLSPITVDMVHHVVEWLKLAIAKNLQHQLTRCYLRNNTKGAFALDAKSIGKRDLKNICLHYLIYLNSEDVFALCLKQIRSSNNLTDVIAGLTNLVNSNYKKRFDILDSYYKKWHQEPNLINRWFTIFALVKSPDALTKIKKLITHPAFNLRNPNNVYALIRNFAENNLVNFHVPNGAGYRFLTQQILKIDKFNPQLAANLTSPLTVGYKLDKKRQKLLQHELLKIKRVPKLSTNVYEVITRALPAR